MVSTSLRDSIVKRRYGRVWKKSNAMAAVTAATAPGGAPAGDGHDHDDDNEHERDVDVERVVTDRNERGGDRDRCDDRDDDPRSARNLGQAHGRAGPSDAR